MKSIYFRSGRNYTDFEEKGSLEREGGSVPFDSEHDNYFVPAQVLYKHTVTVDFDKSDSSASARAVYEIPLNTSTDLTLSDLESMSLPNPIPEESEYMYSGGDANLVFGSFAFYSNSYDHSFVAQYFDESASIGSLFIRYENGGEPSAEWTVTVTDVVEEM